MKKINKTTEKYNKILDELTDNDELLMKLISKTLGVYNKGLFHILFLHRINLKGKYLKKLFVECCSSNFGVFLLTLNVIENKTFSITEIFENLNLDNPIPFINDINKKTLNPRFYNKIEEHKGFCILEHEKFEEKFMHTLKEKQTNKII